MPERLGEKGLPVGAMENKKGDARYLKRGVVAWTSRGRIVQVMWGKKERRGGVLENAGNPGIDQVFPKGTGHWKKR